MAGPMADWLNEAIQTTPTLDDSRSLWATAARRELTPVGCPTELPAAAVYMALDSERTTAVGPGRVFER